MQVGDSYGFETPANAEMGGQIRKSQEIDRLYEECLSTYAAACLFQIAYKITKLSYFAVLSTASYAALAICLARKVFRNYTFFQYCERECVALVQKYPLLPIISMVVAGHFRNTLPVMSLGIALATGAMVGFTLRVKWLSCVMHWHT